ncbi:hypothetical protein QZH41_005401 [Actinostola sp. cb2023]|nr:hypothetical protein QZH41_005401 [Actinostola sp. cb2023]
MESLQRYVVWGPRWWRTQLTYYITFGKDLYEVDQVRIFKEAFERWSKVAPKLQFTRTMDPKLADFKISFGYTEHSGIPGERKCTSNFDGWTGVLAHAYAPRDGRIHFDENEWWSAYENSSPFKVALPQTATHEIGHALGLSHSDEYYSMMYPSCCQSTADLHQDDIDGIRKIYE